MLSRFSCLLDFKYTNPGITVYVCLVPGGEVMTANSKQTLHYVTKNHLEYLFCFLEASCVSFNGSATELKLEFIMH